MTTNTMLRDIPTIDAGRAAILRALHHGPDVLIVPNAWDAVSARLFEEAGLACVGTTSAGIAWSSGYADGQRVPRDEMIGAIKRIAGAVTLPVTADIEAGYGTSPETVFETVRLAIAAGASGINLEDATGAPESPLFDLPLQCERVAAAREAADVGAGSGAGAVVNARTDMYWLSVGADDTRLARTIERLVAFREAGADCVFVPRVHEVELVRELVTGAGVPLNILAAPGTPDVATLRAVGVARVSVGSGVARAAAAAVRDASHALAAGRYDDFLTRALSFAELEALFATAGPMRR